MTNFLLSIPIFFLIYLYLNIKKNKFLLLEAFFGVYTIGISFYYIFHLKIHHIYKNITQDDLIETAIYYLYFFLIGFIFYLTKNKYIEKNSNDAIKNFFLVKIDSIFKNYHNSIYLYICGIILFLINRTNILTCNNDNFSSEFTKSLLEKAHTFSYFGNFICIFFLAVYIHEILSKNLTYIHLIKKFIFFFIYLIIFIFVNLIQGWGTSVIFLCAIILLIIIHSTNNKLLFIVFLFSFLWLVSTMHISKQELRKYINPSNQVCKLQIYELLSNTTITYKNFISDIRPRIMLENGTYIYPSVSKQKFIFSEFLKRMDLLLLFAQTKKIIKNDSSILKKGTTYFEKLPWQTLFGLDIKVLHPSSVSSTSINMPAIIESYYNFGIIGFIIFSIFIFCFITFLDLLINKNLNSNFKIFLLLIISPIFYYENHLIFMLKNMLYICFVMLIFFFILRGILFKKK